MDKTFDELQDALLQFERDNNVTVIGGILKNKKLVILRSEDDAWAALVSRALNVALDINLLESLGHKTRKPPEETPPC